MNSNMLHLCVGVCDSNGEWIIRNFNGEHILKGKTEVDLYHGETSFLKIYFREISKKYPRNILNLVVYVKPSILTFGANNSSIERQVDCADIEPLVIRDISVLSKKHQ
eukprot:TRINITY_DN26922_c0_g1_i1.p1 TRINITY_DN26922_c0_g1~~TRINITY_DN26922_c0_g1_i1.p1  ORF type:complete len:108 (-),score=10.10 TRINITY_DN26922_c0_g1_i1:22-345(-)